MGIDNRDYFRSESPGRFNSGFSSGPREAWKTILIITAGVFILQIFSDTITYWLRLDPFRTIFQGQIWRLLTYAFCHSRQDVFHILFNMLLLYFFGRRLESMYGSKEFAFFYCLSAIFSGLVFLCWGLYLRDLTPALGASGAVCAVVLLYAFHFPREQIYLFGLIAIEMRWLAGAYVIFDLFPILNELAGRSLGDGVAHSAHLGGMLFAWLYFSQRWRVSNWIPNFSTPSFSSRRGPKLKIYHEEPPANLDDEVDRILKKIQDEGEASLSESERKLLMQASERYKQRSL